MPVLSSPCATRTVATFLSNDQRLGCRVDMEKCYIPEAFVNARLKNVALHLTGGFGADILNFGEKGNCLYQLWQAFASESRYVHAWYISTKRLELNSFGKKRGLDFVLQHTKSGEYDVGFTPESVAGRDVQCQQQACRSC